MTKVLLDTNIIIKALRSPEFESLLNEDYPASEYHLMVSFANLGEVKSLALRRLWGEKKQEAVNDFFARIQIIREVSDEMIEAYAELEAYSLNQHPTLKKPEGESAYKIGKNDLWIAATAQVEKARLLTADRGFVQFNAHFFPVDFIEV
jgi:predicted nucleic acid-binding protein